MAGAGSRLSAIVVNLVVLTAIIGGGFALSGLSARKNDDANPAVPARVFALPEVVLAPPSPEVRAALFLQQNRPDEARRVLLLDIEHATEPSLGRLRYLLAKATPDINEARPLLEALAASEHALAGWGRLRLTERLRDVDPNAAAESAGILLGEPLFRPRAERLLALSLYAAGRKEEADPLLRGLVAELPEKSAGAEIVMPLADIMSAYSDLESQKYALALYRRVATHAPVGETADRARAAVLNLLQVMPASDRLVLSQLSADDAFAEAEATADARDYPRAAMLFGAIAQRFKGDPKSVCDARLGQGKALVSAKKTKDALTVFEDVARLCHNADLRASAHFQAGRLLLRSGDPKNAIVHYEAVAREAPANKLADDALLAAASAFQDLKDNDSARARLRQLLALKVHGDLRPEARFLLAWLERDAGHFPAALAELDKSLQEGPGETREDVIGRSEYWRARVLLRLERRDDAEEAYLKLFRSRPLSYYGQQALARIHDLDAPLADQLVETLREETPKDGERVAPLRLAPRPEVQRVEFQRAIELLRVAEPLPAVEELTSMGCFAPESPDELYLLCASMFSEFGAEAQATSLARKRGAHVMNEFPKGQALALWRVVYPRAYAGVLDEAAKHADVPPSFVRAIAREESSFDPNAVSPASAYGLIQLIRPTARTHAGPLRLPADPESLKNPEINLRIGAAFMHSLFERYKQNYALVPSAYNAGPGATDKWLRERGQYDLDEWVELIPYTETRRYTRRVLQSYTVYAWLDEGRVPGLPKVVLPPPAPIEDRSSFLDNLKKTFSGDKPAARDLPGREKTIGSNSTKPSTVPPARTVPDSAPAHPSAPLPKLSRDTAAARDTAVRDEIDDER